MGLAEDAGKLADGLGLSRAASAVRNEVATAQRIVRANLNEANKGLQGAKSNLQPTLSTLQQTLGVAGAGGPASVCDAFAMPFVHGEALHPEIRKLLTAMDHCPEEAVLHGAHEELKQLDHELAPVGPLQSLADGSTTDAVASALAAVGGLLHREASHDEARTAEESAATERGLASRADFLRNLEAREQPVAQAPASASAGGVVAVPID